jgi:hypothetical protein
MDTPDTVQRDLAAFDAFLDGIVADPQRLRLYRMFPGLRAGLLAEVKTLRLRAERADDHAEE